ncbi:LOW QUALITY PROTEIN: G2/mitotic-specific cyclin-2-like [Salvia miltiorrhiza]|uniref:LOW QUALITY PROTEIN: G2/mitotic-specific cyclin-2-like n=1 Tax=Salvia miltiorrhiza TaxID=226208 RepID=UPI0025AD19C6|nr:LOW QUALITY PROTEIN: G2/mitotic-specific cyclin-2-like [Salvia miltiorrhiza]
MAISNENNSVQIRPTNVRQDMEGRKFGGEIKANRRALGVINQNYNCVVNKRGFAESNGICDKNCPVAAHRPITRKYAAQMAVSQHPCPEESKKPKTSSSGNEFTVWEDVPLTDAEDNDNGAAMPMSLEQSEIEMSEKNQMEVEMEDIFEETVLDIDGGDAKDPLAVVDYVEDLYASYKKMESSSCVSPCYMAQQFDINERMRAILIDWLIEVHHKFELREETLFLTVNLIDRFLEKQSVVRKKLQLVGLVALLLACKYEEVSVPVVDDLVFISDKAYTRKEVLEMERLMLNTLQFNMSVPTPYVFMKRFLKAAQSDKKLELLSFFLIELCQVEYEMLKYSPSFLVAAAIYTAQSTLYGGGQWSKTCEWHTGYTEDQLLECSRLVVGLHERAGTGKLTGVHRSTTHPSMDMQQDVNLHIFLYSHNEQRSMYSWLTNYM